MSSRALDTTHVMPEVALLVLNLVDVGRYRSYMHYLLMLFAHHESLGTVCAIIHATHDPRLASISEELS